MMHVGIPYLAGGRTAEGCDCFGLVLLYYKNELGVELPDYTSVGLSTLADYFRKVETPQKHDVIVFDIAGDRHVGIAVSAMRFLHNISRANVVVSRISSYAAHIKGVYRYENTDNK